MLFRKLKLKDTVHTTGKPDKWYLILRNVDDVLQYMDIDADLCSQALLALPNSIQKSHLEGSREKVLNVMIQSKAYSLKDGEKVSPINVLCDLVDGKTKSMINLIERGEEVLVQQSGGYCTYQGYVDIWGGIVVEELEKDSCYYPEDDVTIETDLLFLENSERVPVDFEREVYKINNVNFNTGWNFFNQMAGYYKGKTHNDIKEKNNKIVYKISHLKLRDPKFVSDMISKAKVIAFETQAVDKIQIDNMFKLFSTLEGKSVIISTLYKDDIINHDLYETVNNNNSIKFI